jgi:hypothetical protein
VNVIRLDERSRSLLFRVFILGLPVLSGKSRSARGGARWGMNTRYLDGPITQVSRLAEAPGQRFLLFGDVVPIIIAHVEIVIPVLDIVRVHRIQHGYRVANNLLGVPVQDLSVFWYNVSRSSISI